jgi:hypothetical protein
VILTRLRAACRRASREARGGSAAGLVKRPADSFSEKLNEAADAARFAFLISWRNDGPFPLLHDLVLRVVIGSPVKGDHHGHNCFA